MSVSSRGRMAAAVLVALVIAASCGGGEGDDEESSPDTTTTTTGSSVSQPSPATTEAPDGPISPLTGLAAESETAIEAPVLVVKIGNNDARSRPQTGLLEADVVYEELVEGVKTRFAAVFQSVVPEEIGPVRSGRTGDIDLLAGLNRPMFSYSGGNVTVLAALRRAGDDELLVDVGALRLEDTDYSRSDDRDAPFNLYLLPGDLDSSLAVAPSPIFSFGALPAGMGTPTGGVEVKYPASFGRRSTHLWDGDLAGWVRVQDGTLQTSVVDGDELEVAPANVLVLHLLYTVSAADPASPEAQSFGEGPAQVFTRGVLVEGTWSRSQDDPIWALRDDDGREIPLAPGTTWVLLVAGEGSSFASPDVTVFDPAEASSSLADVRAAFAETAAS